eukprot:3100980-Pyramimonas_sp.AAC.1
MLGTRLGLHWTSRAGPRPSCRLSAGLSWATSEPLSLSNTGAVHRVWHRGKVPIAPKWTQTSSR